LEFDAMRKVPLRPGKNLDLPQPVSLRVPSRAHFLGAVRGPPGCWTGASLQTN